MPLFAPAVLLFVVGWLVKYRKWAWLIAGYNTSSKKQKERYDLEKLTRVVGNLIFSLAGIFLAMALGVTFFPNAFETIINVGLVLFIVTALGGVLYMNTNRRVLKN